MEEAMMMMEAAEEAEAAEEPEEAGEGAEGAEGGAPLDDEEAEEANYLYRKDITW